MFGDITGVILSMIFVVIILVFRSDQKIGKFSTEFTRKFIHIGVSHWWIVAMFLLKTYAMQLFHPLFLFF